MSADPLAAPARRPHGAVRAAILAHVREHPGAFTAEVTRALVAAGVAGSAHSVAVAVDLARKRGALAGVPVYAGAKVRRLYLPDAVPPLAPDGTQAPCEWCTKPATGRDETGDPECDGCRALRATP